MADGLFVSGQRHDVHHHAAGGKLQRGGARIEGQHFLCRGFEIGDDAVALAHQRGQGITGGKGVLDAALNRVGMVLGHADGPAALLVGAQLFRLPCQERACDGGDDEHRDHDHLAAPCRSEQEGCGVAVAIAEAGQQQVEQYAGDRDEQQSLADFDASLQHRIVNARGQQVAGYDDP